MFQNVYKSLWSFSRDIFDIQRAGLSCGIIMHIRRRYEHIFKHGRQHTVCQLIYKECYVIVSDLINIQNVQRFIKRAMCVLGWTPRSIWTIFFCSIYYLCRWTDAVVTQICTQYAIWGIISALYKFNNVSESKDNRAFMTAIFSRWH